MRPHARREKSKEWIDNGVQLGYRDQLLTAGSLIGSIAGAVRFTIAAELSVDTDTVIALPFVSLTS